MRTSRDLGHSAWVKVVLAVLFFVPIIALGGYDPASTPAVIAAVLSHPLATTIPALLPVAKAALLVVACLPFLVRGNTARVVLGYYAAILVVVGFLQNMAFTESYGFVWIIGNTLLQLAVAAWCLVDVAHGRSRIARDTLDRGRLWVLIPMALALVFPYAVDYSTDAATGVIRPALDVSVLGNDAGVTYCMITPVVLGILLIHARGVHSGLLSVVSWVGAGFGVFNMLTWFVLQPTNWWMGVLHLPLMVLTVYGLVVARAERRRRMPAVVDAEAAP